MPPPRRIDRALVTGASAGIGAEFARQLAARGVDLVLVARREQELEELARGLRPGGTAVEVLPADLATEDGRGAVEARLRTGEAPVHLLVNNAGFGAYGAFADLDAERQAVMVELNVTTVVRLTHVAVERLRSFAGGGVINVASTASFQPNPYGAVYGASKAFVRSFTEALHEEMEGSGVRVMALCPGYTETGFQQVAGVREGVMPSPAVTGPAQVVARGLRDFARGHAVSVPGVANRLSAYGSQVTPSVVTRRLSGLLHRSWSSA